jgi:transcription elongation GreA/GreB family factor
MSRAFVKEQDADFVPDLSDRPISEHPNDVTELGMRLIDQALGAARQELAEAQISGDRNHLARAARELRYWASRQASARVIVPPIAPARVTFGVSVTIVRDDGRQQTFRIVGEDEADPSQGTISYVSPLARSLFGKKVGEEARAGQQDAEIIAIG